MDHTNHPNDDELDTRIKILQENTDAIIESITKIRGVKYSNLVQNLFATIQQINEIERMSCALYDHIPTPSDESNKLHGLSHFLCEHALKNLATIVAILESESAYAGIVKDITILCERVKHDWFGIRNENAGE